MASLNINITVLVRGMLRLITRMIGGA
jgi:hypothetical protein